MADPGGSRSVQQDSTLSIGQAEFQRMQSQLIDLRTTNYQLKEHNAKLSSELSQLQETAQSQSRDLDRAHKTIQRSKKAKELSGLIEENDSLQRKMESQEEDFRLQNRTLMEELAKVCDEREVLGQELEAVRSRVLPDGVPGGSGSGASLLTHLQAENTALQKSLQMLKERLQETVATSHSEDTTDAGSNGKVLELDVQLATAEEEKRLLQQSLTELQMLSRRQQAELQSELEKWTDKAKKKQDSLLQLQEEKERQYVENRASFNEMARTKELEMQVLREQLEAVQQELAGSRAERTAEPTLHIKTLSTENEELTLRCAMLKQEKEALVGGRDGTARLLEELGAELQQSKGLLGEERKRTTDLTTQLEEAKMSQEQLADQVVRTSEEKHQLLKELEAAQKVAGKRKALLDEMSIKEQQAASEQIRKHDLMEEKHIDRISRLEEQLLQEQARARRLAESSDELPGLRAEVATLQESLASSEVSREELQATVQRERGEHCTAMEEQAVTHQEETQALCLELEGVRGEVGVCRERVVELEAAVQDKQAQVKIVERKSQSLLKDLKRQLQQMHKREERLQEQVSDLRGGQALDQYFSHPTPSNSEPSHDSASRHSRDSSLSSLRGVVSTDSTAPGVSPSASAAGSIQQFTTAAQQSPNVSEETRELLARIAELQQEKWSLEERVSHLETTGSALAEDVIQKSEIIKSFYIDTQGDHQPAVAASRRSVVDKMSPMRLVHWARGREDAAATDINRKMQNALEEALTKNIHLQENMDLLSGELHKQGAVSDSAHQDHNDPQEQND